MTANPMSPIPPIGPTTGVGMPPTANRFKPLDPLRVLREYMRLFIVTAAVGVVLAVGIYILLRLFAPAYTSQAQLQVVERVSIFNPNEPQRANLDLPFMQTQAIRIVSEDVLSDVIRRPRVRETQWFKSLREDVLAPREAMQKSLRASPITGSTLIRVSMTTRVPEDASVILNEVIDVYLSKLQSDAEMMQTDDRRVLLREVERAENELQRLNDQRRRFVEQHNLTLIENRNAEAVIHNTNLARRQSELLVALEQSRKTLEGLERLAEQGQVQPTADELAEAQADPAIRQRDEDLRRLREQREVMLHRFGENHREVQTLDRRMAAIEGERQRELERLLRERQAVKLDTARANARAIEASLAAMQPELEESRARMADLTSKLAEYRQLEELADAARARRDQAEAALRSRQVEQDRGLIRVRRQLAPTTPILSSPRAMIVIPGITLLALGAVAGLVFLYEMLDQRIKSGSDVRLLPNAELLGILPDGAEDPSGPVRIEAVVRKHPTGLMAESFRHIRTALLTRMDRRGYKTLLVVGARPSCGASAVAGNLAFSLAYNDRRVLVLDANLRRPTQHETFEVPAEPGLVEVLREQATLEQAVRQLEDPSVSVLAAGHVGNAPPELLEGPAFRKLLTTLEGMYDMILIDAPPALLASDAQLLAKHVDAMAVVVRAVRDKRGMVERVLKMLDGQRADLLGVILNGVQSTAGGYLRKNYQEFYRYGAANGRTNGRAAETNGGRRRQDMGAARRDRSASPSGVTAESGGDGDQGRDELIR